jgi:hypothetical protein
VFRWAHILQRFTYFSMEKVYFTPRPMKGGTHHPSTYENGFFSP